MKTIYLTEEQAKMFLRKNLLEGLDEKSNNALAQKQADKVISHLQNKAKSGDESLLQKARENGINIDSLKGDLSQADYDKNVSAQVKKLVKAKNKEINGWVKKYLPILRDQYRRNGKMTNFFNVGKDEVVKNGTKLARNGRENGNDIIVSYKPGSFDSLDNDTKAQVYAVREFLDKEGLTFLYRPAPKQTTVNVRYNVNFKGNIDCNTPVSEINIDFGKLTDKEIEDYYDGTRIKWINAKLKELGYDVNSDKSIMKTNPEAWEGENGVEGGKDIAREGKLKMVAERYVQRKYGMSFNFGQKNNMFSFGNQKINDDTLIVNFAAAMRCPAWNECLLKDACYARNTERGYDNVLDRNLKTNLVWEQTQEDPELMKLMSQLIRSYMLDYKKLSIWTRTHGEVNAQSVVSEVSKKVSTYVSPEVLCEYTISEIKDKYGDEAIELLTNTRRGNLIRLNEDGDFIGQWLVDAWDKWAGDFKLVGINVTAYTCRALNYEKVKNLILNISQEGLVAGQNSTAFAHYFYAVTPDVYDKLGETYNGTNFGLNIDRTSGKITPVYRHLINENGELVGYYYKCPCGRGKYKYIPAEMSDFNKNEANMIVKRDTFTVDAREDSPIGVIVNGQLYKRVKNTDIAEKADCYRCRICYGRDAEEQVKTENGRPIENGLPVYVLVSAHGANKDDFNVPRRFQGKTGEEWAALQQANRGKDNSQYALREGVENGDSSDPMAIKQITKNAISSVAEMMRGHINGAAQINEMRDKFYNLFNRIK